MDKITISNISKRVDDLIICAIERDEKIIVPSGNTKLQAHDTIFVSGTNKSINKFLIQSELIQEKTKKVIISGGSNTAIYLAKNLLDMGMQVKIIEINPERCAVLSEKLPDALIINGDVPLIRTETINKLQKEEKPHLKMVRFFFFCIYLC